MHLGNFIFLISISTTLSSQQKKDHEVIEKNFVFKKVNQSENAKIPEKGTSLDNNIDKIIESMSHFKNESKLNQDKIFEFEKKKRKMDKSIKVNFKDRGVKLESSNSPDVSRLSDEILTKIRKLLENEIKEINEVSKKRSSDQEIEKPKSFLILKPFTHTQDNIRKEKENWQTKKLNDIISIKTKNETSQIEEKKSQGNSEIEFKLFTETPDTKTIKESSSESPNEQITQNKQINMLKLSRNGGIENNLSRKEIGRPSWRSELLDTKQKTQEVASNVDTVYLKIFSSLQGGELNSTKLDQESAELSILNSHVQQSSQALKGELENKKTDEQQRPTEVIQSRTKEDIIEPKEEDLLEAANFGMQAMNDLYYIKEPKLYSLGLFLAPNNPAHVVASFNQQSEDARHLAKFGFAALQGSILFANKYPEISRNTPFTRSTKNSALHRQCPKRGIPQCPPASMRYRTSDGSCNNAQNLWWGSAMSTMQRFLPPLYQDGIQNIRRSVSGDLLPSAREVSQFIHEDRDIPLASVSHMLMQWGQFVDHDVTASVPSRGFNGTIPQCCLDHGTGFQSPEFMHPECLPIAVHPRDNFFSRFGVRCLEFLRNAPAPRENCEFGPREQVSQVTSYLDASTVYGSNVVHSDSLRIFRDGLLQYGKLQARRNLATREDSDICQLGSLSQSCFIAGDGRLGENPALTSLHVVFLRLHNRIAVQIAAINPHWSEERMFQETRKIVGAVIQHITYREFLPIVLGQDVMKIFQLEVMRNGYFEGYDPTINPNIANEFATAAFRFGHSLVQPSFVRFDKNHRPLFNNVSIHEEFVNPHLHAAGSLEKIILGLVNQPSQKRDEFISEELTNHLFQRELFPFGMDLASINVQRGRDHGLPPYIQYRSICGLSEINNWEDLERIMEISTVRKFRFLYSSIEDIDLFSAGLAEKSVGGGLVGPTFACIIAQQFSNLKRGDRFWFENLNIENRFTLPQLEQIRSTTLAQVLCKTMDNIESIQPFVMQLPDNFKNHRILCDDPIIGSIDVKAWLELTPVKTNKTQTEIKTTTESTRQKVEHFHNTEHSQETIKDFQDIGDSSKNVEDLEKTIKNFQEDSQYFQENIEETFYRSKGSISKSEVKKKGEEKVRQSLRPMQTSINQQNRIVLKRPIAPQENISIVVHNVAVNAPVFVKDSVYGSHLNQNPQTSQFSAYEPNAFFDHSEPQFHPNHRPSVLKPLRPTFTVSNPYIPQNFDDTYNPNPPSYGFHHNPVNNFIPNNAFFENMHTNNYRPYEERPNYNQESVIKPISETPEYNSDRIPQNSWNFRPGGESYQTNFGPYTGKPSNDNPNPPESYQSKPIIQNAPNYQIPLSKTTTKIPNSSSRRPSQNRPTRRPGYFDYSDITYKNYKPDPLHSKPVTLPSFTVITETLETVRFAGTMKPTVRRKHGGELPKPLIPQHRIVEDSVRERAEIAGPGRHYFDRNILYKYPKEIVSQTNLKLEEKEAEPLRLPDDKILDGIKFTTTATIVLNNDESNPFISTLKPQNKEENHREKESESIVKENEELTKRSKDNSIDFLSNLTSQKQQVMNSEFSSSKELPKPIKIRASGS